MTPSTNEDTEKATSFPGPSASFNQQWKTLDQEALAVDKNPDLGFHDVSRADGSRA